MRVVLSVALALVAIAAEWWLNIRSTLFLGAQAGNQFANSDQAFLNWQLASRSVNALNIAIPLVLLVALALIWRSLFQKAYYKLVNLIYYSAALVFCLLWASPVLAYYDKTNWPEPIMVMPNESAFWIPDAGANKDSQTKFGSEDYYKENKVAAKRFEIPHVKYTGSSYFSDYYVPAGRLIIVPREPVNRTWTKDANTGTVSKDQSFRCQSSDGIDIWADITIGASILEEQAARYLYRFPVKMPAGDRKDPVVIFTSVYYASGLQDIMDTVIWGAASKAFCAEIMGRTFDQANADGKKIVEEAEKAIKAWASDHGITIEYFGMAGGFGFEPAIQKAINDKYEADKIAPVLDTIKWKALFEISKAFSEHPDWFRGIIPALPQTVLITPDFAGAALGLLQKNLEQKKP